MKLSAISPLTSTKSLTGQRTPRQSNKLEKEALISNSSIFVKKLELWATEILEASTVTILTDILRSLTRKVRREAGGVQADSRRQWMQNSPIAWEDHRAELWILGLSAASAMHYFQGITISAQDCSLAQPIFRQRDRGKVQRLGLADRATDWRVQADLEVSEED